MKGQQGIIGSFGLPGFTGDRGPKGPKGDRGFEGQYENHFTQSVLAICVLSWCLQLKHVYVVTSY